MIATRWYFHSYGRANTQDGDGTLSTVAATMEPVDSFVTGTRAVDSRIGPVHYTSSVFVTAETVDGPAVVDLYAASSEDDTMVVVAIFDVHPDGQRRQLTNGRAALAGEHVAVECAPFTHTFDPGHRASVEITADSQAPLVAAQIFHDAVRPSSVAFSSG
jgi:predicted acyl esterase